MRHLTVSILVTIAVLLGSAGESFALPECPVSPTNSKKVWTSWNNCEGTVTHADGDKYVGELKDGKRHGQGTLYYLADNQFKGDIYVGEFKDGKWHGQGTYTFADGRVKEGIWEYGKFKYAKKTSPVVIAKKTPKPKPTKHVDQQKRLELTRRTQEALNTLGLYSGKLDGIIGVKKKSATQRWQKRNGYPSTGEVTELQLAKLEQEAITHLAKKKPEPKVAKKKPPKQSPPTKSGTSGSEGWNLPPCSGTYNEDTYADTTWTNCEGTETYASGNKYVGEYKDGKKHGQGTYTFADGGKYVGEFKDGKRHGQGTDTYASGGKYVGEYKDGKRHGQGTYTQGNGDKYVGELKDGKPHGQSTFTFADGRVQKGIWENGKLKPWWKFW